MDYGGTSQVAVAVADGQHGEGGLDGFVSRDGLQYAGGHLLVDLWQAQHLDDAEGVVAALRAAARAAGATVLHAHAHRFGGGGGVSAIVVLAESHISIHTWPERQFAAVDIFMCGNCNPYRALPVLRRYFRPTQLSLSEHRRGLVP